MPNHFAAPAERVAVAPGAAWNVAAVIVDDDGSPIGLVAPGDTDAGTFRGAAFGDTVVVRQLRAESVAIELMLEHVGVGAAGGALERLGIVADVAIDGRNNWRGLSRLLVGVATRDVDAVAGNGEHDHVDDAIARAAIASLEGLVRDALALADVGEVRDGSLGHAIVSTTPLALDGPFRVHALRVTDASWSGREGADNAVRAHAASPEVAGSFATPASASDIDFEGGVEEPANSADTSGVKGDGEPLDAAENDAAEVLLEQHLGSSPALAEAWARESAGDPVAAIGGVVVGDSATVLVLHPEPDRLVVSQELFAALGAEMRSATPRLIVLPAARTLRELMDVWLTEQAMPAGIETAIVVDRQQRRVVLELDGAGAASFVGRIAETGAADLAALGAVLPWRITLRAVGDDGLVSADSAGNSFAHDSRAANEESVDATHDGERDAGEQHDDAGSASSTAPSTETMTANNTVTAAQTPDRASASDDVWATERTSEGTE